MKLLEIIERIADYCDDELPLQKNTMLIARIKPSNATSVQKYISKYSGQSGVMMFTPTNKIDLPHKATANKFDIRGPVKIMRIDKP